MFCLGVDCRGISIVWSAYCGYILYLYYILKKQFIHYYYPSNLFEISLILSILYDLSLWIYYGIVSDTLTTIAHIAAILLGFLIAIIFHCIVRSKIEEMYNRNPIFLSNKSEGEDEK